MSETLKLWFFRDLSDEQRLKLFGLFGLPVDEIGNVHAMQAKALGHIMKKLVEMVLDQATPPPATGLMGRIERLEAALKPFARIADMEERAGSADSVIVNVSRCRDARAALAASEGSTE